MFTRKSLNKPLDYIIYIGKYNYLPVLGKRIGKVAYTIGRKTLTNGNNVVMITMLNFHNRRQLHYYL